MVVRVGGESESGKRGTGRAGRQPCLPFFCARGGGEEGGGLEEPVRGVGGGGGGVGG